MLAESTCLAQRNQVWSNQSRTDPLTGNVTSRVLPIEEVHLLPRPFGDALIPPAKMQGRAARHRR
jgi:hypothetical protein